MIYNYFLPETLPVLFHFPNLAACSVAVNLLHTFGERGLEFPAGDGRLWRWPPLDTHLLLLCCHLLQVRVNLDLLVIGGGGQYRHQNQFYNKLLSEFGQQAAEPGKQHEPAIQILVWLTL